MTSPPSSTLFSTLSEDECTPRPGLEEVASLRPQKPDAFGPLFAHDSGSEADNALQISNAQVSTPNHPSHEHLKLSTVVRQDSAPCYAQDSTYGTASSSSPSSYSSSPFPLYSELSPFVNPEPRNSSAPSSRARRRISRTTAFLPCPAPNCKLAFTSQDTLDQHSRAHELIHCGHDGCNRTFKDRGSFRKHRITSHPREGDPKHACRFCNYTSPRRDRVRIHERRCPQAKR